MANYSFFLSDGVTEITVTDSTVNNNYTLPLLGQNVTGYGDDVAIGTMRHLENFSASVAPNTNPAINGGSSSVLKGQLWFDSANNLLNVNIGTTATPNWQPLANAAAGTQTSSMLRWGGSAWVEETQMRVTSGGTLQLFDTGLANNMAFQATGTAFNIDATTINTVVWSDIGQYMQIADGAELRVSGDPGNAQAIEFAPGDAASVGLIRTVGVNRFRVGGSITRFDVEGALGLEERASAPTDVATFGQVWVNSADNGLYYTNEAGADTRLDVTAGGTVTGTGSNDRVAVWSGTNSLDSSAGFTWNGTNLSATNIGGILEANLVDKAANESIAGQWTFTNATAPITVTAEDIVVSGGNGYVASNGGSAIALRMTSATDANITTTGTAADLTINDVNLTLAEADTTKTAKLIFLDVSEDDTNAIEFYPDPANGFSGAYGGIRWFDQAGDPALSIIPASGTGVLQSVSGFLFSDNAQGAADFLCTISGEMSFEGDDGASHSTRFVTNDGTGNGETTKMKVVQADGSSRNVGYNETPEQGIGALLTLSRTNVGKILTRDGNGAANSIIQIPSGDITMPNGATWIVSHWAVGGDTGTLTIQALGVATLYWLDGSGAATATTGDRTLAKQGICTIRRHEANVYHIWGSGLS